MEGIQWSGVEWRLGDGIVCVDKSVDGRRRMEVWEVWMDG